MSVQDKVVVITGAGRGIGLAAVELFLEEGAKVLASDVDLSEAQSKLKESDKLAFVKADVTDEAQVESMFKTAMDKWGKVDSCIPNAGIFSQVQPWTDTPVSDYHKIMNVNTLGPWLTVKHAVRAMLASPSKGKGCTLVFVASVAATYGHPGLSTYTASKWSIRGLSLTAAQEFAEHGIRSNCIAPGAIETPMFAKFPAEAQEAIKASNTMKRAAKPKEVAELMLFLASDKSSFMNGSTVAVHAGQTPT